MDLNRRHIANDIIMPFFQKKPEKMSKFAFDLEKSRNKIIHL